MLIRSFLLFLLAIGLIHCQNPSNKNKDRDRLIQAGLILYLIQESRSAPLDDSECSNWSSVNRAFERRYKQFLNDKGQYQNLILGDSTMDISGRYVGFFNPSITQNLAVGGNSLCDIIRQFSVIQSQNPQNILVSTVGGIDLLQGIPLEKRGRSLELLIEKIQNRFPNANISMVAVHPTQIPSVNQERGIHNNFLKNKAFALLGGPPKICWLDPLPLFGDGTLSPSDPAPDQNMIVLPDGTIDPVHYNKDMSFAIKEKLELDCNLFL